MQLKFKRHQSVILKSSPNQEYIEWYEDARPIKPGTKGKINVILSNGKYHVQILDENDETMAYAAMDEEQLEAA
jgi:hypothetical protein